MYKKMLMLVVVAMLLGVACTAHRVDNGVLRDTLFSVEETRNGYWRIWMTHDDIAGYCTNDSDLGQKAMHILQEHHGEVIVEFRSINADDPEADWWDNSECGDIDTGSDSSTAMFMLTAIEPVPARN